MHACVSDPWWRKQLVWSLESQPIPKPTFHRRAQPDLLQLLDRSGTGVTPSVTRTWDTNAVRVTLEGGWTASGTDARRMAMLAVYQVRGRRNWGVTSLGELPSNMGLRSLVARSHCG
jgi:hypothetical protein